MRLLPMLALLCSAAFAQNTDLGVLVGISGPEAQIVSGAGGSISSSVGAHLQVNFAFQLKENKAGRLYLEMPLLFGGHVGTTVGSAVSAYTGGTGFFTPGVRWNFPVHPRISLYGTAGAGLGGAQHNQLIVAAGQVNAKEGFTVGLAGQIGAGLDLRLSRLMSLRFEARDFITGRGFDGVRGHNHVIYGIGFGFHW